MSSYNNLQAVEFKRDYDPNFPVEFSLLIAARNLRNQKPGQWVKHFEKQGLEVARSGLERFAEFTARAEAPGIYEIIFHDPFGKRIVEYYEVFAGDTEEDGLFSGQIDLLVAREKLIRQRKLKNHLKNLRKIEKAKERGYNRITFEGDNV